jgi:predicted metalloprotease with PDZ domain
MPWQPYDWAGFFNQRLHSTGPARAARWHPEHGGWKLVYDAVRSDFWRAGEDERKLADLSYSLGLKVQEDGLIEDVVFDGPARKAGIAPATRGGSGEQPAIHSHGAPRSGAEGRVGCEAG